MGLDNRKVCRIGLLLFLIFIFPFAYFIGSFNLPRYFTLAQSHTEVAADITKLTPENHNTFCYSFKTEDRNYVGLAHIDNKDLRLGQKIPIAFSIKNPNVSCEIDDTTLPIQQYLDAKRDGEVISVALTAAAYAMVMTIGTLQWLAKIERKSKPAAEIAPELSSAR